jgi:pantothenate kinase
MTSSPFRYFNREEWAALRSNTPLSLSDEELATLCSMYERLSLTEVAEVHLPLSRFLNLHVKAAQNFSLVRDAFLGRHAIRSPFVIAISGSVAVGKSTFARVIQAILARWPDHPSVELVTTDGFLYPNAVLEQRGLMKRKGFPESYDLRRFISFLSAVKASEQEIEAPVYSHLTYDILADKRQIIKQPDILIFERDSMSFKLRMVLQSLLQIFLIFQFISMPMKPTLSSGISNDFFFSRALLSKSPYPISVATGIFLKARLDSWPPASGVRSICSI